MPWPYRFVCIIFIAYLFVIVTDYNLYPIQNYTMFSETTANEDKIFYEPFMINTDGETLVFLKDFDLWPVRAAEFQTNFELFDRKNTKATMTPGVCKHMLKVMQSKYPNKGIKCFGINERKWRLSDPVEVRWKNSTVIELAKVCDDQQVQ